MQGSMVGIYCSSELELYPEKAHESDAGYDLYSTVEYELTQSHRFFFPTGIHLIIPNNKIVGIIKPRSGWAYKYGIDVLAGVIDSGYTGELKVGLVNHGCKRLFVKPGMKIAQILFLGLADIKGLDILDQKRYNILKDEKDRQDNGFGSTGE